MICGTPEHKDSLLTNLQARLVAFARERRVALRPSAAGTQGLPVRLSIYPRMR
jgi:hypothetical protein